MNQSLSVVCLRLSLWRLGLFIFSVHTLTHIMLPVSAHTYDSRRAVTCSFFLNRAFRFSLINHIILASIFPFHRKSIGMLVRRTVTSRSHSHRLQLRRLRLPEGQGGRSGLKDGFLRYVSCSVFNCVSNLANTIATACLPLAPQNA